MTAWLHIVGIGEDGLAGLSPATRVIVEQAELLIGGKRHHALVPDSNAERISWPSPFDALIETLRSHAGKRVVVLATGDPLWYSVGARIGRQIDPDQIVYHPQLSAFQWAASRLGWSLADLETLTVHGRAIEQIAPYIAPEQRLLVLTAGSETPEQVARLLTEMGYGGSRMSVLAAMGGKDEKRFDGTANDWDHLVPALNTLAIECVASANAQILPRVPGLPDAAFDHDGTMTKQEVRAATLAKLMPMRGALLWDIGCGCGSVAVEWMRSARDARAVGIEIRDDRRALAATNAVKLGVPKLNLIAGDALEKMTELDSPDAIFVGGGLSEQLLDQSIAALRPFGRIVSNAVTLESQNLLVDTHKKVGGDLVQISVNRADPVGSYRGWRPSMPVMQWSWVKR